ncbi:MAG TPA: DUF1684 domain-containing protein [Bryobacteraceae bacterium]|nr:DUF1684 domain-containing protein [Bryobacteraceae bacterium]
MLRMALALAIGVPPALSAFQASYPAEIAAWRHGREARLTADDGWLTVAGLFWLHPGANSFGKASDAAMALPDGPPHAGVFTFDGRHVTVTMNGATREVTPDADTDRVKVGRLSLLAIRRGDRFGIRLKDPESPYRRQFHGLEYFPISQAWRVTARWVAAPKKIPILNVLGQTEPSECPGYAEFELGGQRLRLYPILESPDDRQLFYIFRDETAGKETYGAGRFLYSDMPRDGQVVLDFNKAYNPPCSFTPYATCPLPPPENRLGVRIEAGEKKYGH